MATTRKERKEGTEVVVGFNVRVEVVMDSDYERDPSSLKMMVRDAIVEGFDSEMGVLEVNMITRSNW